MIKRVKRTVRQSAVSHPAQHHSPLNSSCHLVSSATPHWPGRKKNPLTAAPEGLLKSFVRSEWVEVSDESDSDRCASNTAATVGFFFFFCGGDGVLKNKVMARAKRWGIHFDALNVTVKKDSFSRMCVCVCLLGVYYVVSGPWTCSSWCFPFHHIIAYFIKT